MPELIAAYPDAKIIITMRDPDAWFDSVQRSVGKIKNINALGPIVRKMLMWFDPFYIGRFLPFAQAIESGLFGQSGFSDAKHCKEVYVRMHEEVRRIVPEQRLLEFQLKQGWEPMCKFLGKDIPGTPFPHINESSEFDERARLIARHAMIRGGKRLLLFSGFIIFVLAFVWKTVGVYRSSTALTVGIRD